LSGFNSAQFAASSGRICTIAIAKNTPAAKEFAIPNIFGLSLQDFDQVGIRPVKNASKKTKIQNPTLTQKTWSITI